MLSSQLDLPTMFNFSSAGCGSSMGRMEAGGRGRWQDARCSRNSVQPDMAARRIHTGAGDRRRHAQYRDLILHLDGMCCFLLLPAACLPTRAASAASAATATHAASAASAAPGACCLRHPCAPCTASLFHPYPYRHRTCNLDESRCAQPAPLAHSHMTNVSDMSRLWCHIMCLHSGSRDASSFGAASPSPLLHCMIRLLLQQSQQRRTVQI